MTTIARDQALTSNDHLLQAIIQQISILDTHAADGREWSPGFIRQHALMIVQMSDSMMNGANFGCSGVSLL